MLSSLLTEYPPSIRMDGRSRKILLRDLNAHLICVLCGGYYIDATSISECLHTFCKACIVKYLETNRFCPICDVQLHKNKPLLSIRPDKTLQRLVYKMVPGLYSNEMQRRRQFYLNTEIESSTDTDLSCDQALALNDQQRPGPIYYSPEDSISLSLEYYISGKNSCDKKEVEEDEEASNKQAPPRRYLKCPAGVKMYLLKKFLRTKYNLAPDQKVDIIYADECLPDEFSLMDVAYTFMWNRMTPMRFRYRIFERSTRTPATYMGSTTSPQPTVTSDYPESTHQSSSHNNTDEDSSSRRQQFHGDKRQLMESDSEVESAPNHSDNPETHKEKVEPPLKKARTHFKKSNDMARKKVNNYFKSPDRRKQLKKGVQIKNINSDDTSKKINVHSITESTFKECEKDSMEVEEPTKTDDTGKSPYEEEKYPEKASEISNESLTKPNIIQDEFIFEDQPVDDDLEEDDEGRLRISPSEEDIIQDDPSAIEDTIEPEPPEECSLSQEITKDVKEKQEKNIIVDDKKEVVKKDVEVKIKKKNKKAKHHHHHRHHDRKRDYRPPPAATILHSPDMKNDIMKLKVKLTAVKPDDQSKYYHRYSSHSPTRHHNSKHKTTYIVSEESEKGVKSSISSTNEDSRVINNDIQVNNESNKVHDKNNFSDNNKPTTLTKRDQNSVSNTISDSCDTESNKNNSDGSKSSSQSCVSNSSSKNSSINISNNKGNDNCNSGTKNNSVCTKINSNNSQNSSSKNISNNNVNSISSSSFKSNNSSKSSVKNSESKNVTENLFNKNRDTNSIISNKEKLLQMRSIRLKNIQNKKKAVPVSSYITTEDVDDEVEEDYEDDNEEVDNEEGREEMKSTILIPPSSITVSKITAAEKKKMDEEKLLMMSGKHNGNGLDSKRPSLEIMLVNAPSSKTNLKSQSSDDKQNDKFGKVVKSPPASIPLVRIQKTNSLVSANRHPVPLNAHKLNKPLNKSSVPNKTYSNSSNKDVKSKAKQDEEIKDNQPKLTSNALSKMNFASSQDDFGALDLSDKSSRKGSSSASSSSSENSNCPSPNSSLYSPVHNSLRPYPTIHGSPGSVGRSPSCSPPQVSTSLPKHSPETSLNMFPPSMRNLLTLSDTAAHIRDMMAARDNSKGQLPSPNPQKHSPQRNSPEISLGSKPSSSPRSTISSSSAQLKIPVPNLPLNNKALANRGRCGLIPNLNEINPGSISNIGRGKTGLGVQNNRNITVSKPGPNQTVRHIPNPSVLLFRQQNQLKNMNATIPSGPTSPSKKYSINGRGPTMPPPPPAIPLSTLRRMESMTRNIEKVAAGLSVRAAVEALNK